MQHSTEIDYGKRAANALLALAIGSILLMVLGPVFSKSFFLDLSPIFNIWAASKLRKHSNPVRQCIVVVYSFAAFVALLIAVLILIFGARNFDISLGSLSLPRHPAVVVPIAMSLCLFCLYPVVLLTNKEASSLKQHRPALRRSESKSRRVMSFGEAMPVRTL